MALMANGDVETWHTPSRVSKLSVRSMAAVPDVRAPCPEPSPRIECWGLEGGLIGW